MPNLFTPVGFVASSSLFKAKGSPSNPNKPEFYLQLLFPDEAWEGEDAKRLIAAMTDLARGVGGANFQAAVKTQKFRWPLRKIDHDNGKGWPAQLTTSVNMKSGVDFPPRVVDQDINPILDPNEIYPGCRVRASVSPYAYSAGRSPIPGVSIGLNNVQKISDGPRFAGARGDGSEFGGPGSLASDDEEDFSKLT